MTAARLSQCAPAVRAPALVPAASRVSAADDAHEREADRVADQVLADRVPDTTAPTTPRIQRRNESTQAADGPGMPAGVGATLAAGGSPLEPQVRQDMERRFDHDFSRVRIHADTAAQRSAREVTAQAYTVGPHIVFGAGRYAPQTRSGRHLLAHELTHVLQQGAGTVGFQRKLDLNDFDTGHFDLPTLKAYLAKVGPGRIEDKGDSDDKARAIVGLWHQGKLTLDAKQKIALVQEMQSGFTGNDDERAILTLLVNSPAAELPTLFASKGGLDPKDLDSDFQGPEEGALRAFYDEHFIGGRKAALDGGRAVRAAKADEPVVQAPAAADAAAEAAKTTAQGPPRQDFVFIMGDTKRDAFYREALRYFSAHRPQAIFVVDKRSLTAVLSHIASQITAPIGNLYLVSHANEDGTLSFGLDGDDKDKKLNVTELREALHPTSGKSALSSVAKLVDAHTVVRIKGCDIGRTKEMLDLLDEAFGGAGTVTAPTHEQVYGTDPTLAREADTVFRAEVDAHHAEPPPVDKTLKGKELASAKAARAKAMKQRGVDIRAELKSRDAERTGTVAQALTYEAFSGPMFQRPGETLFTEKELLPELKRLYGHLSDKRRAALAKRLVAKDGRPDRVALKNGTYQQSGQRVFRRVIPSSFFDPADAAGFLALFRAIGGKTPRGFVPGTLTSRGSVGKAGQPERTFRLNGSLADGSTAFVEFSADVVPSDAAFEQTARASMNNPDRYTWSVTRSNNGKSGKTTLKATATRVVAYLHHASLDASLHAHFDRAESDGDFYAQSTFAPPPPKPKP